MTYRTLTIRLTNEERSRLEARAAEEGVSIDDLVGRFVRDYLARTEHHDRVSSAADRILDVHAGALDRLDG
jgi:hypothetical protein